MHDLTDIFLDYQKTFFKNKSKRKIWIAGRQIGKSFTVGAILCFKALSKKNGLSLCISTGSRAASEIIRKCAQFAEAVKLMTKGQIDYTASYEGIKFSNGSRIMSLPSSTDGANLRGFTAQCVCIDEAAHVWHLDQVMQAINPTLSRDKNAELILTTTPAGKNGPFYELYSQALDSDEWYIQTTTIHDAVKDGLQTDIEALKSLCPDPEIFAQEYECQFSDEYGSFIDLNVVDFYDELPKDKRSDNYFGMDVGVKSDRSGMIVGRLIDGVMYLDDILVLNKMSFEEQLSIFKDLNIKYKFRAGYVDATGIGYGLSERVQKEVNSQVKGMNFTGANKTPMYEQLRTEIFQHKLRINRKFKDLILNDFKNVARIISPSGKVKFEASRNENGHSDVTSAITLLVQASKDFKPSLGMPVSFCGMPSAFGMRRSRL